MRQRGFTLIELSIAIALVGILAALALPSYVEQVNKSRRADAFAALSRVQQAQERHRGEQPEYAGTLELLRLDRLSPAGHYVLSLSTVDAAGYTLKALPAAGSPQAADRRCAEFSLHVLRGDYRLSARNAEGGDSSRSCVPH